MKYFGFLLHFYQPPWQYKEALAKISAECYYPLLKMINDHPCARFTVNINYSLVELLKQHGHEEVLSLLAQAVQSGKIELTNSGAYHPILPLLDEEEINRQIDLNEQGIKSILGLEVNKGFFPPEMAFSPELAATLKNRNCEWTITDDATFNAIYGYVPHDFIPQTNGLPVILRSHYWSSVIAFRQRRGKIFDRLDFEVKNWFGHHDGYVVVGMDAETFGHHHAGYIEELAKFLDDLTSVGNEKGWTFKTISEICRQFPARPMEVPAGSWSTDADDIKRNVPFPLWDDPLNLAHHLLWELTNLVLEHRNELSPETRPLLDKALNSCQFWWVARYRRDYDNAFQTIPIFWKIVRDLKNPKVTRWTKKIIKDLSQITNYSFHLEGF